MGMLFLKTSPCFTLKHPDVLPQYIPMFWYKTSRVFWVLSPMMCIAKYISLLCQVYILTMLRKLCQKKKKERKLHELDK